MSWEHDKFWLADPWGVFLIHLNSSITIWHNPHKPYQKGALPQKLISVIFVKNLATLITTNSKILGKGVPQFNGMFCERKKKLTSAYMLHYVPSILGSEESEQLILICLWNKVCRKTGFHKAQTIQFETPQTEVYCQIWGRILGEPRRLAALEAVVSSATGHMSPKGRNIRSCSTEFQRKKSSFPINEELFSKLQCDYKLLFS